MDTALKEIFGSKSAEVVLLYLYQHGEGYGRSIARESNISLESLQRRLRVFENNGVLISKKIGSAILYRWNESSPFSQKLKELVGIQYENMSSEEREGVYEKKKVMKKTDTPLKNLNDFLS